MGHFDQKLKHPQNSASAQRIFFQFWRNGKGHEACENCINSFSKKNLILVEKDILYSKVMHQKTLDQL